MTDLPPKPPRPVQAATPDVAQSHIEFEKPKVVTADENPEAEQRVRSALPGVTDSKMFFGMFIFNPDDTIPKSVLIEVLRAARLSLSPVTFDKLSPEAKRQFLHLDRSGTIQPYRPERKS